MRNTEVVYQNLCDMKTETICRCRTHSNNTSLIFKIKLLQLREFSKLNTSLLTTVNAYLNGL